MATVTPTQSARTQREAGRNPSKSRAWKVVAFFFLLSILIGGWCFYWRPMSVTDEAVRLQLKLDGIDSHYTQVGIYRVHYFVGGEGTPLLLIHGLGARSEDWAPEMPAYAKHGFRVYAIDLLGCGRTSRPDISYSMTEQAELIEGFLNAMHLQQVDIAGWSMGGWVALKFTMEHPERVSRLVLMDSAGLLFEANYGAGLFEPKTPAQLAQLWDRLTPHPKQLPGFVARDVLRRMQHNDWVIHRTVTTMLTGKDLLDGRLGQIHIPVLIVWGAQDTLIPPSSGEQMHQEMPQSVLELYQGCGHIAPATCAAQIVPRVRHFLDSQPAMAGGTYHF